MQIFGGKKYFTQTKLLLLNFNELEALCLMHCLPLFKCDVFFIYYFS